MTHAVLTKTAGNTELDNDARLEKRTWDSFDFLPEKHSESAGRAKFITLIFLVIQLTGQLARQACVVGYAQSHLIAGQRGY